MVRQILFKTTAIGIESTKMAFVSVIERLGSTLIITRKSGDLLPRNEMGRLKCGKLLRGRIRG